MSFYDAVTFRFSLLVKPILRDRVSFHDQLSNSKHLAKIKGNVKWHLLEKKKKT